MPKGIYAAASGMVAERRTLEVIAQNLAHAQTSGYRRSQAVRGRFAEYLAAYRGRTGGIAEDGGAGSFQADLYRDFSDGQRVQTDGQWDLALHGEGFYRVRDEQGQLLLTRVSNFVTDNANRLVTAQGLAVEGQGGPVTIPPEADRVSVDERGRIYAYVPGDQGIAYTFIDQLRVASVDDPNAMRPVNGQYFDPGPMDVTDAADYHIQHGFVEQANVDPIGEMVRMIAAQRRYDAAQRSLTTQLQGANYSDLLGKI